MNTYFVKEIIPCILRGLRCRLFVVLDKKIINHITLGFEILLI